MLTKANQTSFKKGIKHPGWKGDQVSYNGLHRWLRENFGNPSYCEKCGLKGEKKKHWNIEWALIKGKTYVHNRENFIMLCKSCHLAYDGGIWNKGTKGLIVAWNKGKKGLQTAWNKGKINVYSKETKEKMRKAHLGKKGYWTGKKFTDEHRRNLSLAHKAIV